VFIKEEYLLFSKNLDDLILFGKTVHLVLGENELSIDNDVEDAAVPADQLGLDAELFLYSGRQTGGLWEKVSGHAIGYRNLHLTVLTRFSGRPGRGPPNYSGKNRQERSCPLKHFENVADELAVPLVEKKPDLGHT